MPLRVMLLAVRSRCERSATSDMRHERFSHDGPQMPVFLPDGMNLNQELVKQGWCWWYRKYAPEDTVLEGLEKAARDARKGLWADAQPVPPWEWRKR